ncbi:MAG TPA: DUF881 domain-containing protein [Nocardioides sp.]|nr:DUF881 domain-containing protein [Nocardioides sp.]
MTGAHQGEEGPRTRRPRRSLGWRIGTPAVVLASGALFAVSAADSGGTDLRPGRYTDLASLVQSEADDVKDLQDQVQDLHAEVDALTEDVGTLRVRRARSQIEQLRDPAGLEPRSGPGLRITLADAPQDVFEAALDAGADTADLNRYVVHQQDIQAVVNALWSGGAEAITIAGQRVISTTGIKCEGNAVQLQGVPYPQPYVVEAVGDPTSLLSAIDDDPLVAGYRADADNPDIAVGWDLAVEDDVEAPAYEGLTDLRYATPLR